MAAVAVLSPMTHDNEACASDISALVSVDFDSWSKARLNSLCDAMKKQNCGVCDITPNGWQQVAKAVGAEPSKLREAVLHEFRNDIQPLCTPVDWPESRNRHLLIGTLSSAQSRLLVVYYNIRKILQLFSAPVDELWSGEGVTYKMMVLDASNDLFPALDECMEFLAPSTQSCGVPGPDAALVCCGTGIRRSAAVSVAYFMYLDEENQHSCDHALEQMSVQRPSVDISGGSATMVGGDGQGLLDALKMWEWCLVAKDAAGRQEVPTPEGAPPIFPSPRQSPQTSPSLNGKRKTPVLEAIDPDAPAPLAQIESPETPGKKACRGMIDDLGKFTLE